MLGVDEASLKLNNSLISSYVTFLPNWRQIGFPKLKCIISFITPIKSVDNAGSFRDHSKSIEEMFFRLNGGVELGIERCRINLHHLRLWSALSAHLLSFSLKNPPSNFCTL